MIEFEGSNNNSRGSIDDEVTLMSKKFKQMLKKEGKFERSSRRKGHKIKKEVQREKQ